MRVWPALTSSCDPSLGRQHGDARIARRPAHPDVDALRLTGGLLAGERRAGFCGQVDEGFAADVDDDALDGAAEERPGRFACVVVGDRLGPGASDDQAAAAESELAGLGPDRVLTDLLVADIEAERALGGHRVALPVEGGRQDDVAARDRLVGLDDLLQLTDEVVDVCEPAILHVKGVAAEPRALGEDDAAGFGCLDVHLGGDRVGAVADVGSNRLGHLRPAGEVDVASARLGELGPLGGQNLDGAARLERQRLVLPRFGPPQGDQLLQLLGVLFG